MTSRSAVPEWLLQRVAEQMRVLGQTVRLRLVEQLTDSPMTTQELADALGVSQPNASRHLRLLYAVRLVSRERHGTRVRYNVTDDGVADIVDLVAARVSAQLRELPDASRVSAVSDWDPP